MKWRRQILSILPIVLLLGCVQSRLPREEQKKAQTPAQPQVSDYTEQARAWADSVTASLPLERKAAMVMLPALYTSADAVSLRHLDHYVDSLGVGGIILLKGDTASAAAIHKHLSERGHGDLFVAIDAEWGLAMRLKDAPRYPANGELGGDVGDAEMFDYGEQVARQCRALGINMVLGPVADVLPKQGRSYIGKRSFGSDADRVSQLAASYAQGLESGGVMSVAKHFPGQGSLSTDTHKQLPTLSTSLHTLDSIDLEPFREYIARGLSGMMVGHMAVPAIDAEKRSAALSPVVMKDLLRKDLQFKGLIITDALNMAGAMGGTPLEAVMAGADMVIAPTRTAEAINEIVEAVKSGVLSGEELDDRCRRILFYKYRFTR